jgi:hypothetical protein
MALTQATDTNEVLILAGRRLKEATELDIQTAEDLPTASQLFNEIRNERDRYERTRKDEKEPHLAAGRAVDERWKPILDTHDTASSIVNSKISIFRRQAEKRAAEEQARLRAQQEKERQRLAKQAERAEARGLPDTADALIREAETMQPAIVAPAIPARIPGLQEADNWQFEVESPAALPREYLLPDLQAIRKVVKAMKDRTNIPGVRVWNEPINKRGR